MEVIRHGNTYKEAECKKCNALLSYCKVDIQSWRDEYYYSGEMCLVERQFIECPECKTQITLAYLVDGIETSFTEVNDILNSDILNID